MARPHSCSALFRKALPSFLVAARSAQRHPSRAMARSMRKEGVFVLPLLDPRARGVMHSWHFPRSSEGLMLPETSGQPCHVAHPAMKGSLVKVNPSRILEVGGGHVGVVKPLDAEAASEWGAGLLGVREALSRSRRCAWCANGVHDRGGWYPWRSVQVEWLVGDTKGKVYYYKAGHSEFDWFSTGRNQSDFDLVQAGCQKTARLDWAMLQKEAREVDAAMELKASEIGVGHHIVKEIIACEAAFGHALPLRHTHASRKREVARAARKRANAAVARKRAMEAVARKRTESRAVHKRAQVSRGGVAGQSLLTAFFKAK